MRREKAPVSFAQLEMFRMTLPEPQRHEPFRFFMITWDMVRARYLIQRTNKRQEVLNVTTQPEYTDLINLKLLIVLFVSMNK